MRAFNFPLDPVLRYRSMVEEQRKIEFSNEMRSYQMALDALNRIRSEISEVEETFMRKSAEGLTAAEAQVYVLYLSALRSKERTGEEELRAASERLERARQRFIDSQRNRRVIETLKEKAMAAYAEEIKLFEQKTLDEISTSKYARDLSDKGAQE